MIISVFETPKMTSVDKFKEGFKKLCEACGVTDASAIVDSRAIADIHFGSEELNVMTLFEDALGYSWKEEPVEDNTKEGQNADGLHYYIGNITPAKDTIFVFGSNPEGRHGAGSAKVAVQQFGAIYGQGEGLQGSAYALPTTDLRSTKRPSMSTIQIIKNIQKMYACALEHPDKKFKVAYRNDLNEVTLCGYKGADLMQMFFIYAGDIPTNVYFSQEWINNIPKLYE